MCGGIDDRLVEVVDGREHEIFGSGDGHCQLLWEPGEGVDDAFLSRLDDPDFVTAVVFEGWADVPGFNCVGAPSGSLRRFEVCEDFDARWCDGGAVEFKASV